MSSFWYTLQAWLPTLGMLIVALLVSMFMMHNERLLTTAIVYGGTLYVLLYLMEHL